MRELLLSDIYYILSKVLIILTARLYSDFFNYIHQYIAV